MQRYSFNDVTMLINGVEITGWDEGDDVIQVKRRSDSISDKMGAGGDMMVSVSTDKSGEFTFKLQQTSSSNKFMMAMLALEENSSSTFVPVTVLMQDTFRRDLATGTTGYIKKPADMTRGAKANGQEWTIVVERLDLVFGLR